jgi:hypothetical protein
VPADIETEPHGQFTSFAGCDVTGDGDRAFESWTGKAGVETSEAKSPRVALAPIAPLRRDGRSRGAPPPYL